MSTDDLLVSIGAALDVDGGLLCTRGKLRRVDPDVRPYVARRFEGRRVELDVRPYVARRFEGRRVEIVDRHGRTYAGTVLVVSVVSSGAFSHALTLRYDDPGLWPVSLSLAVVDTVRELRPLAA